MTTTDSDFKPGNPADHVVGKPDEKPARKHAPQPPKPIKTARGIHADIKHQMQVLEPLVEEYRTLEKLAAILEPATTGKKQRALPSRRGSHKK